MTGPGQQFADWNSIPDGSLPPLGKIAAAYALDKTGAKDWLNKIGVSADKSGQWSYNPPASSLPPPGLGSMPGVAPTPDQLQALGAASPVAMMPPATATPVRQGQVQTTDLPSSPMMPAAPTSFSMDDFKDKIKASVNGMFHGL